MWLNYILASTDKSSVPMNFKLASARGKKPGYFGLSIVLFLEQNMKSSHDLSRVVTTPEVVLQGLNKDHSIIFSLQIISKLIGWVFCFLFSLTLGETLGEFYKLIVCTLSVNAEVRASYHTMDSSHIFTISTSFFLKSRHQRALLDKYIHFRLTSTISITVC